MHLIYTLKLLFAIYTSFHTFAEDAAYEGTQKRTFLVISICLGTTFAILVGFIALFPKLAPQKKNENGDTDEDDDEENIPMLKTNNENKFQ